jgi:hypothetical protein
MPSDQQYRDPEAAFHRAALQNGLVPPGTKITPQLIAFAHAVAELCAVVGDAYDDALDGNAGEHIRALYGSD